MHLFSLCVPSLSLCQFRAVLVSNACSSPLHPCALVGCHKMASFPHILAPYRSRRLVRRKEVYVFTFVCLTSSSSLYNPQTNTGQRAPGRRAVGPRARTSPGSQGGVNLNAERGGIMAGTDGAAGSPRPTVPSGEQRLRQASDWAVTLSGACLCAFCATLLYHLLCDMQYPAR